MIGKIKRDILSNISKILRSAVRSEIENALPIIPQLIEFQNSPKENRSNYYDHTKNPAENIQYYEGLKARLIKTGVSVKEADVDIVDFELWLNNFPKLKKHYEECGDVFIEKCLEHYLAYRHLRISKNDVYFDIGGSGSPWAEIMNLKGIKSYRLDLSFPHGVNGINIGADAGNTKLPDGFASVLSLQCAYECFIGDADISFIREASRILNEKGRYGIIPLYLEDNYFVSSSPYCDQSKVKIEPEAKIVWRDDSYKVPFSRTYSPESFYKRIYSHIREDMMGKILYFRNIDEVMKHYPGQRVYCFFGFLCKRAKHLHSNIS